jgi:Na+/H+ antiporter NhaD/arsenite permease-like protein
VRLLFPLALVSSFLNNTPVVAILIPVVRVWCRQANLPPGQLFIPVSYTAILGGTVTLIGTSTNLVVAGKQAVNFPEQKPLGIFDLTPYGLPVALVGILYIILFAPVMLPGRVAKYDLHFPLLKSMAWEEV